MLVLWDPTWVTRFWCVFELASYLHSRDRQSKASQHLRVRPNLMGPVLLTGHAGLCILLLAFPNLLNAFVETSDAMVLLLSVGLLPCFGCLAHVGRAFCRSLDTLQQQLGNFSAESAKCFCCDVNHVDPYTGGRLICDRDIMLKCIGIWFGSPSRFDELVRGQVRTAVLLQLMSTKYLYQQLVVVCSPVMWLFLDRTALYVGRDMTMGDTAIAVEVAVTGLAFWLWLLLGPLTLNGQNRAWP